MRGCIYARDTDFHDRLFQLFRIRPRETKFDRSQGIWYGFLYVHGDQTRSTRAKQGSIGAEVCLKAPFSVVFVALQTLCSASSRIQRGT